MENSHYATMLIVKLRGHDETQDGFTSGTWKKFRGKAVNKRQEALRVNWQNGNNTYQITRELISPLTQINGLLKYDSKRLTKG